MSDRLSNIERCQVIASHGAACIREAGHDGPHSTVVGSRWHESEIESLRQQLRGAVEERDRYRAALLRIWIGDTGPAGSAAQFAFQTVHPDTGGQ